MKKKDLIARVATIATSAFLADAAAGAIVYDTPVNVTKANGDFIAGTGIPANGFAVDTDATTGVSVALKARSRNTGQAISINNERYTVLKGLAADNTSPWWTIDIQFSPGDDGTIADAYQLFLDIDFDPGVGTENYVNLGGTVPVPGQISTINNPGPGGWSDDDVDYVVSESWHLGFSFWNTIFGETYDPNAEGEYLVNLVAKNSVGATLATSSITVVVVPEPTAIGFLCLGGAVLLLRRKR